MAAAQRIEVHFAGRVQGVGFRHTTTLVARDFDVTGFVQNLTDGRVRLVAEGEPDELKRFVAAIDQRMSGLIRETLVDRRAATGEFTRFAVKYSTNH